MCFSAVAGFGPNFNAKETERKNWETESVIMFLLLFDVKHSLSFYKKFTSHSIPYIKHSIQFNYSFSSNKIYNILQLKLFSFLLENCSHVFFNFYLPDILHLWVPLVNSICFI